MNFCTHLVTQPVSRWISDLVVKSSMQESKQWETRLENIYEIFSCGFMNMARKCGVGVCAKIALSSWQCGLDHVPGFPLRIDKFRRAIPLSSLRRCQRVWWTVWKHCKAPDSFALDVHDRASSTPKQIYKLTPINSFICFLSIRAWNSLCSAAESLLILLASYNESCILGAHEPIHCGCLRVN
jgi:hypothetical protein